MRLAISKSFLTIILVLLVVVVLHYSGIISPVENLVFRILSPVGSGFYSFSQKVQLLWREDITSADYEKLLSEKNWLIAENARLQTLERENGELRKALNFKKEKSYDTLMANVVGRDPNFSNYFILNKGEKDGIQNNLPVVSPEGILVGKILKVSDKISVMLIPTDSGFETAAAVLGGEGSGTSGLLHGEKGLGIKMEFIPQEKEVSRDDIVVTSGLELNMPKGLVIGKVAEVKRESRDIFGEATISPLAVYESLDTVTILLPRE
ncbi:MAG: rod shape-determining protein MreC [Patescibacteria group bacterium]